MTSKLERFRKMQEERENSSVEKELKERGEFFVAGVTFDGRQEVLEYVNEEYIRIPTKRQVRFILEPENKYDENAIKVEVDMGDSWYDIGYVPKTINQDFKVIIDSGKMVGAKLASVGRPQGSNNIGAKIQYEVKID